MATYGGSILYKIKEIICGKCFSQSSVDKADYHSLIDSEKLAFCKQKQYDFASGGRVFPTSGIVKVLSDMEYEYISVTDTAVYADNVNARLVAVKPNDTW